MNEPVRAQPGPLHSRDAGYGLSYAAAQLMATRKEVY